jgi:hypothetical protein
MARIEEFSKAVRKNIHSPQAVGKIEGNKILGGCHVL